MSKYVNVVDSVTVGKLSLILVVDIPSHTIVDVDTGKTWIFLNVNDENLWKTLAHELMHALGLKEEEVRKIVDLICRYVK